MVQSGSICVADYTVARCQVNGGGCKDIFALSLPGVIPDRSINYFIAAAACRNSEKCMLRSAECQATIAPNGSRTKCKSDLDAYDMVANVVEY